MDGGIKISNIRSIRYNWDNIREKMINEFKDDFKRAEYWEESTALKYHIIADDLPKKIDKLSDKELFNLLLQFKSCDMPIMIDEMVITAKGDYVEKHMQTLSLCLEGGYYETWS